MGDIKRIIIKDLYEMILQSSKKSDKKYTIWPKSYHKVKKVEFLDKLKSYFEAEQDYEKCSEINKLKEEVLYGEDFFGNKKNPT